MFAAALLSSLVAVGNVDTRVVPANAPTRGSVLCSLAYGCEIDLPAGEKLRDVRMIGEGMVAQVVASGDTSTANMGAVIEVLPTSEFSTAADGAMQPVTGRVVILTTRREYNVIVDASETQSVNRLVFTGRQNHGVVIPMPPPTRAVDPPTRAAGEALPIDPSQMDFGWRMEGDASMRCVTVFSTRGQIWCKMPVTLDDVPSAYYDDGKLKAPLNARVVAQHYLVVDSVHSPILLEIGGGHPRELRIIRGRE